MGWVGGDGGGILRCCGLGEEEGFVIAAALGETRMAALTACDLRLIFQSVSLFSLCVR